MTAAISRLLSKTLSTNHDFSNQHSPRSHDSSFRPHPKARMACKIDLKATQDIENIQRTICKTQEAVSRLKAHQQTSTFPACLKFSLRLNVTALDQSQLDEVFKNAISTFQTTLLGALLNACETEFSRLVTDQSLIRKRRQQDITSLMQNLESAHQPCPTPHVVAGWNQM
jgi:hypothetical protein